MKFGKRLNKQIEETLPEWRDKFLSYKNLKKLLRLISSSPPALNSFESQFIRLLHAEIHKLNSFFVEQEEDFVIRQKELQERFNEVKEKQGDISFIRKDLVNFHGEMVLLENYSSVNYTGLAKILKKYDKRTGGLLRLPFIEKVLKEPFFNTELVSKLVKECERMMESIFPEREEMEKVEKKIAGETEQSILRNTFAALATMEELRKGSSTYGRFSLPPIGSSEADILQSMQPKSPILTQ